MRRPRSKLQVSTFPFLAVLLCIMGSLMLLLFIMDRRGKIAARYRVTEELKAREARSRAEENARQDAWEKAKLALHQSLLDKQAALDTDAKSIQQNLNDATQKLGSAEERKLALASQLKSEAGKIVLLQLELDNQRTGIARAQQKELASKAELDAAAQELVELELAFRQLKTLKANEKDTYSVVPYHGKRGDTREPIYIECVRAGILFHPDKKLIEKSDLSLPDTMRAEVERRHGPLAIEKAKSKDEPAKGPYVLFLVRPDGVATYYQAMSGLKGYQLDFGYELVDQSWALDFSAASAKAPRKHPQQAWTHGDGAEKVPPQAPSSAPKTSGGPLTSTPQVAGGSPGMLGIGLPTPPVLGSGGSPGPSFVPISKNLPAVPIASSLPPPVPGGVGVKPGVGSSVGVPAGNHGATGSVVAPAIPAKQASNGGSMKASPENPGGDARGLPALPAFGTDAEKKPPPASPLSKLLGNKDFIITIECRRDAVTVMPGGFTYQWTTANLKATDAALVETVKNLITRRQASVRPGEPPYRPIIRFEVSTEGLRTYYHVYPLLEPLPIAAMTRENIVE